MNRYDVRVTVARQVAAVVLAGLAIGLGMGALMVAASTPDAGAVLLIAAVGAAALSKILEDA